MNHNKMQEYSRIGAMITSSLEGLFKAQDALIALMCQECDIPAELKDNLLADMNKVIGVKTL